MHGIAVDKVHYGPKTNWNFSWTIFWVLNLYNERNCYFNGGATLCLGVFLLDQFLSSYCRGILKTLKRIVIFLEYLIHKHVTSVNTAETSEIFQHDYLTWYACVTVCVVAVFWLSKCCLFVIFQNDRTYYTPECICSAHSAPVSKGTGWSSKEQVFSENRRQLMTCRQHVLMDGKFMSCWYQLQLRPFGGTME
jgi:hypothetical protein